MQIFSQIVHKCPIRYDSTQIGLRQSKYNRVDFLPIDLSRALEGGGGKKCPPLRFFANSGKTAARSAAIFSVPAHN